MLLLLASLAAAQSAPAPVAPPAPVTPTPPRFAKTPIGTCGCSLYAPPGLSFGAPEKSPDGADVWTGEVTVDGYTWGAIVAKFPTPMEGTPDRMEPLLVAYLDFLRGQLGIVANVGVGRGHTHTENPAARGVIDYWKDAAGDSWAVKGWVDNRMIAVLFVSGKQDYPYLTAQSLYLDGFRFE